MEIVSIFNFMLHYSQNGSINLVMMVSESRQGHRETVEQFTAVARKTISNSKGV